MSLFLSVLVALKKYESDNMLNVKKIKFNNQLVRILLFLKAGAMRGDEGEPTLSRLGNVAGLEVCSPFFLDLVSAKLRPRESHMNHSMNYRVAFMPLLLVSLFVLCFSSTPVLSSEKKGPDTRYFVPLKQRLVADGFAAEYIDSVYASPEIIFDSEGTGLFFIHNEGILDYDRFANKTSIYRARKYIDKHKDYFDIVEKQFGVDKTVITAIILVETGLGTYMGKRRVINTLSTMASLTDPGIRENLWHSLDEDKRLPEEKFRVKADKKSAWAYDELKAFLRYTQREKLDPCSVNGSYAGAMGIAQFMPSNILFLAQDGNKDGSIDMFDHKDAIASIANYLRHYGWHTDIDSKKAEQVLYAYNHSGYYVNILMKISRLLKGENG